MKTINKLLLLLLFVLGLSNCTMLKKSNSYVSQAETIVENAPPIIDTTTLKMLPLNTKVELLAGMPSLPAIEELIEQSGHIPPTFYPIVQPNQRMRNDTKGDGHFGASRGRRTHNGLDIEVFPGSAVYCPIEGIMKRVAYPYGSGRRNKKWLGCAIEGTGLYRGYEVKIFYMTPFLLGEYVYPNDIVGKAQAISKKYSKAMTDHLHVEVRYKGRLVNPASLFKLVKQ